MNNQITLPDYAQDVRNDDHDRWLVSLFAPDAVRSDIHTLLAFNAEISRVRETVSEAMLGDIRLQWWRDALEGIRMGAVKPHPVVEALAAMHTRVALDIDHMLAMVDMRAKDLDPTPLKTLGEFIVYADGTGGALQALILQRLKPDALPQSLEAATRCGRAYAMIGILRAIAFHAHHDLLLLPTNSMEAVGLDRYTLLKEENKGKRENLIRGFYAHTVKELKAAKIAAKKVSKDVKPACLLNSLTAVYLGRLKTAKFDPMNPKMKIGNLRKIVALIF